MNHPPPQSESIFVIYSSVLPLPDPKKHPPTLQPRPELPPLSRLPREPREPREPWELVLSLLPSWRLKSPQLRTSGEWWWMCENQIRLNPHRYVGQCWTKICCFTILKYRGLFHECRLEVSTWGSYWHVFEYWSLLLAKLNSSESCASPFSMARRRAYTSKAGWQDDGTVSDRSGGCLCALFFDRSQNLRTNHQQVFHIVWHGTFINALHTNSLTYQHKTTFTASQTPSGLEPGLPLVIRSTAPSFPWPCSTQYSRARAFNTRLCLKMCGMSAS